MSSRLAVKERPVAAQKNLSAITVADARPVARVHVAANEEEAESTFSVVGDPLLGMAIASGIMFLIFAALMASF